MTGGYLPLGAQTLLAAVDNSTAAGIAGGKAGNAGGKCVRPGVHFGNRRGTTRVQGSEKTEKTQYKLFLIDS